MKKKSNIIGIMLLILAVLCIGMYFVYGEKFSDYKVVFDSDGGSTVLTQTVKNGDKVVKPDNPTKENSDFIEWQLNGQAYNFDNIVEDDITLKAIWQVYNMFNVKVTLEENEYSATVREGEQLNIDSLGMPSKEGYRIVLYTESNEEYNVTVPITSELTLIGKYIEIKKYTVKFDANGGKKVSDVKVVDGETVQEPTTTRDGYVFDGWYLGNTKYDFTTPVTKAITLKAKWNEAGKVTVTFAVDGNVYKTSSVKENTKVSKPSNPTKKGYKFVEWQLNDSAFDFNTKITEEITLTAKFEETKAYTVKFDSDGGSTVKSQEVSVGGKVTKPDDPTKKEYVFVEWQLNGKTYDFKKEVVEDITLKAKWDKEKNKYTVKFIDSEKKELASSQTVVEGEKATKPTDPTKDGYKFDSWLLDNVTFDFSTPITKDITLTAHFVPSALENTNNESNTGDINDEEAK